MDTHALGISRYYAVACLAVTVWEILITFPREWHKIWKHNWGQASWNLVKLFYALARYGMLAELIVNLFGWMHDWQRDACTTFVRGASALEIVPDTSVSIILLLRIWTLLDRSRIVLVILATCLVGIAAMRISSVFYVVPLPLPRGTGMAPCASSLARGHAVFTLLFDILPLAYTSVILLLSIGHAIWERTNPKLEEWRIPLLSYFEREGTLFVIAIWVVQLVNLLFRVSSDPSLHSINTTLVITILAIMGARIVLNVHAEPGSFLPDFAGRGETELHQYKPKRGSGRGPNVTSPPPAGPRPLVRVDQTVLAELSEAQQESMVKPRLQVRGQPENDDRSSPDLQYLKRVSYGFPPEPQPIPVRIPTTESTKEPSSPAPFTHPSRGKVEKVVFDGV